MVSFEHGHPDVGTFECIADLVDGSFDDFELVHLVPREELEVHQQTHHEVAVGLQLDDVGRQFVEYVT